MKIKGRKASRRRSTVQFDTGSLDVRVRQTLEDLGTEIQVLRRAVEILDSSVREVVFSAAEPDLRQAQVGLRAGTLQVLASVVHVLAGAGALDLAADLRMVIDAENPPCTRR